MIRAARLKSVGKEWSASTIRPVAGPTAIAMLLAKPKYPIPSPKRDFGMLSEAIVPAAVFATPQLIPCRMRIAMIIATVVTKL